MVKKNTLNEFISSGTLDHQEVEERFNLALDKKNNIGQSDKDNLKHLFRAALHYGKPTLFPKITVSKEKSNDPTEYINKWIDKYLMAHQAKPSNRIASPKKSIDDPILKTLIKEEKNYSDERVESALHDHNMYMDAENIQGSLLEEYIDNHISQYGWIWAEGETIRASDFIKYEPDTDEYIFLQVKNKYNSENSSSSAIREGTSIERWYRLGQGTKNKQPYPKYKWEKLNEIIGYDDEMSEEDYDKFIANVARKNKNLLID